MSLSDLEIIGLDSNSSNSAEESRERIDQQKTHLYELIRQLNSNRNDLALISKLPPELLGRIFAFVGIVETYPDDIVDEVSPGLLSITYVSQKWRNIALDTPHLWATPIFYHPTWAKVMLERSKMADLVIDADCNRIVDPALMKEVFDNHAGRIREICLRDASSSFMTSMLEGVQPSSFRLRSLRLRADWTSPNDTESTLFPTHLLAHPSDLRRLEMEQCAFDWYAQPHQLLTHLMIHDSRNRPLLSEFVTALSNMPCLESLEMADSLPVPTSGVKLNPKVHLPKLAFLLLSSTTTLFEVLDILNFLVVPCTTTIDLSGFESSTITRVQPSSIGLPLERFFTCMTGNHERASFVRFRLCFSDDGINLWAWRNDQLDPSPSLMLTLRHPWVEKCQYFDEIVPRLPSPLFEVQTLVIDNDLGQDVIRRSFGQSTDIRCVELEVGAGVSDFLQVLTYKPEGYEYLESAYRSLTFPALQSLKFNRVSFSPIVEFEVVLDCLMERYERGAELQKLIFHNCFYIDKDDVRLLREIVADVEWDEIEQTQEPLTTDSSDSDIYDDWL